MIKKIVVSTNDPNTMAMLSSWIYKVPLYYKNYFLFGIGCGSRPALAIRWKIDLKNCNAMDQKIATSFIAFLSDLKSNEILVEIDTD